MRAVDLFCGAGGASRGLHDAGFDVVGFDHWQPAVDTHNANGLKAHLHDLSDASIDDTIPDCDLMWLSCPCQPFSAAGEGEGEFDERDGFPWGLRIVAHRLPAVAIFENVKGLTFGKHHAYFAGILESLRALGYEVGWCVLNSADFGVPQTRERCFIVCRRDGGPITWPMPTHTSPAGMFTEPWVTMADALGWSGFEAVKLMGAGMVERHGERPSRRDDQPAFAVRAQGGNRDLGGFVLRSSQNSGNGERTERSIDEPAFTISTNCDRIMLDYRQTNRAGEPIFCDVTDRPAPTVGTMAESQWVLRAGSESNATRRTLDEPAPTVKVGHDTAGWCWERPSTTVNGDPRISAPGHHDPEVSGSQQAGAIRLTIPELAALQGFPGDWIWTSTKTNQARQVGNAVPPIMAQLLAEANRPVAS